MATNITILTEGQSARYLKISDSTFRRLVSSGKIPSYRPSKGVIRFIQSDLNTFLINSREDK